MTQADYDMLVALPVQAARAMERLLYNQARSDLRFHQHTVTGDLAEVELLALGEQSAGAYGTGGGRVRHPRQAPS